MNIKQLEGAENKVYLEFNKQKTEKGTIKVIVEGK